VGDAWERSELVGRATTRPPRAAGRARRQHSKRKFLYIKLELRNFLAKYFCIIRIAQASKSFQFRNATRSAKGTELEECFPNEAA
jgi:hypothetical protein